MIFKQDLNLHLWTVIKHCGFFLFVTTRIFEHEETFLDGKMVKYIILIKKMLQNFEEKIKMNILQ